MTQRGPLADDASFQFIDVRDFGMIESLLKHAPHGVVNQVEVRSVISGQRADGIKSFKCILNYCIDGSIWHFRFPKVVQAHTLGEVDILDTMLLRVSFGTIHPICIEIGSYLTEKEQKISWHSFFETRCIYNLLYQLLTDFQKNLQAEKFAILFFWTWYIYFVICFIWCFYIMQ